MKLDYICPHCNEDAEIEVDYESPSDYYYSYECGNCGKEGNKNEIDELAYDGAADWLGSRIDYITDMSKDRF